MSNGGGFSHKTYCFGKVQGFDDGNDSRTPEFLTGACEGGMNQLTHQEQKIVALIAQGLTNKEIAQRIGFSSFTVRNQVKVIMRKLELKNRVQVAYLIGQHR